MAADAPPAVDGYEFLAPIGSGGMGRSGWRATSTSIAASRSSFRLTSQPMRIAWRDCVSKLAPHLL